MGEAIKRKIKITNNESVELVIHFRSG